MIYFIGGAPRVGKTVLCHQFSAQLGIGWISTDILEDMLRFHHVAGIKTEWDASPSAITAAADWFFPSLERFLWGLNSTIDLKTESYAIEGVDFLPGHIVRLSGRYPLRSVFLGCSQMTPERFDRFPGRSRGYANLPEATRIRFASDIPRWSEFIRQEAARCGLPYIDMSDDFPSRLEEAGAALLSSLPL